MSGSDDSSQCFEKECSKCGKLKKSSEFHNHNQAKDGKYWYCKDCKNQETRLREKLYRDLQGKIIPVYDRTCWG